MVKLDKNSYLPGEQIQGQVQFNLNHPTDIRTLGVTFQGRELVVIREGKNANYSSTNDMANEGLTLSEKTTLPAGTTSFPFTFRLPPDALPSYVGRYAKVIWKLSAKADVPMARDLKLEDFIRIMSQFPLTPTPISLENPEARPKIRLTLSSNVYQPGETVEGSITVLEPGNIRGVRLQLFMSERATAKATFYGRFVKSANKDETRPVGKPMELSSESMLATRETRFQIPFSNQAPCSYQGKYSSIVWYLGATLDTPHAGDIHLNLPFTVAMRTAQPVVAQSGPAPPEAETVGPAQPQPVSATPEANANENIVVGILANGSSKDLVNISIELQEKIGNFINMNQVRELCERLVEEGKLERVSEGEFLAEYRLKTIPVGQPAIP